MVVRAGNSHIKPQQSIIVWMAFHFTELECVHQGLEDTVGGKWSQRKRTWAPLPYRGRMKLKTRSEESTENIRSGEAPDVE